MINTAIWVKVWIISAGVQILFFYINWRPICIDVLLLTLVFWSIKFGYFKGTIVGFLVGLFQDSFSGVNLGVQACSKAVVAAVAGSLRKFLYWRSATFFFFATCIFTLMDKSVTSLLYSHTLTFTMESLYQIPLHGALSFVLYMAFFRHFL